MLSILMTSERDGDGHGIPSEVRNLIAQFVKSVGHLETLLYLFNHRAQSFTALEVSRELRTNEAYASVQLIELSKIIERTDDSFQYKGDARTDEVVRELAKASRERPHSVINYIYSSPAKSAAVVDPIRSFADAFKLKKDPS